MFNHSKWPNKLNEARSDPAKKEELARHCSLKTDDALLLFKEVNTCISMTCMYDVRLQAVSLFSATLVSRVSRLRHSTLSHARGQLKKKRDCSQSSMMSLGKLSYIIFFFVKFNILKLCLVCAIYIVHWTIIVVG